MEGGDYHGTDSNEVFQLIGGAPYYHITARPTNSTRRNRKIFALKPAKNRIVIDGFNQENDIIDITTYSDIFGIGDISFQENPLRLLLFTGQIVQFSGISSFRFTESNFYFQVPTRPRPSANQPAKSLVLTIIPLIIVFLGMACFCFPVIIGNTVDEEKDFSKEKNSNYDMEDVEASIRPPDTYFDVLSSIDRDPQNSSKVAVVASHFHEDLESGIRSESSSDSCDSSILLGTDDEVLANDNESLRSSFSNESFGDYFAESFTSRSSSSVVQSGILVEQDDEEEEEDAEQEQENILLETDNNDEEEEKSVSSESLDMSFDSSSDWESNDDEQEDDSFHEIEFA
jgi:hypothetical protein